MNHYLKHSELPAKACVIWMHGLGADASDMAGLAEHPLLAKLPLQHVFMNAPVRPVTINNGMSMRAWYDILGMALTDREDKQGISESQVQINEVINEQIKAGFRADQIILAGFSQGGAMALHTALHCNLPLAGVISLSAYLPLALETQPILIKTTPILVAWGRFDPLVLPAWTNQSVQWLRFNGYSNVSVSDYPMEHAICPDEIRDIAVWLQKILEETGL